MVAGTTGLPGRPRSPASVAGFGLATLGVGFAWYYFRAFQEVDRDLGRRHSALFFLAFLPGLGVAFAVAYIVRELRGLNQAREAMGIGPGMGPAQHLGFATMGAVVGAGAGAAAFALAWPLLREEAWWVALLVVGWVGPALSAPFLAPTVNGYWEARGAGTPAPSLPAP